MITLAVTNVKWVVGLVMLMIGFMVDSALAILEPPLVISYLSLACCLYGSNGTSVLVACLHSTEYLEFQLPNICDVFCSFLLNCLNITVRGCSKSWFVLLVVG